ncbi:hypothetical protein P3S68_030952 [Capsicum galapagoense]
MVYSRDSTSSSFDPRYLIISDHKDSEVKTNLLIGMPLARQYVALWPSLKNIPNLDQWTLEFHSCPPKTWVSCSFNHHIKNIANTLPCLRRQIINGENRWGETFQLSGEFHYIPGYWEWAKDVLSRSCQTLKDAKIYYAVYGSLFTYDHNTNILQVFCKAWCPVTNTLLTLVGEISLSFWDLHIIGDFSIIESLCEEVVPNVTVTPR